MPQDMITFSNCFMKNVYKVLVLALVMLPMALSLGAQPRGERKGKDPEFWKKAQQEKIEFITGRLQLDESGAKAFRKAYKASEERKGELFAAREKAMKALRAAVKADKADAVEVGKLLDSYVQARTELEAWENSECERFLKVLSPEQVAALIVAEEDFFRHQVHRLHGGPDTPPPPRRQDGDRPGREPHQDF